MISSPDSADYPPYYETYIKLVGADALKALDSGIFSMQALLSDIEDDKENYAYAPGKWTVKEVVGHIIDTERIMAYRALSFARCEEQGLPGFDENTYVKYSNFSKRKLTELGHEFSLVRESNIALFKSFDEEILNRKGIANKLQVNVRALIFIIAGHQLHHMNILKTRYLN